MRLYLDNCAYNRPFDDQGQIRIRLESEAKLYLQEKIMTNEIELIRSYILDIENDHNPFAEKRISIEKWKARAIIDIVESNDIISLANNLVKQGIKPKDSLHVASAVEGNADFFVTTDDRLAKKLQAIDVIKPANPLTMIRLFDENSN